MKNQNDIVIVGGGSSGWMTAATLIKAFPDKKITVIDSESIPTIGVGESTTAFINNWLEYLEIKDSDFLSYVDGSYKMSIKFVDFYKKDSGGFHYPFGFPFSVNNRENMFDDWHIKKFLYPQTPVEDFTRCLFPASALFENNKFSTNEFLEYDNFNPSFDVAYHFNAIKFADWLKKFYCLPRGVAHISEEVIHAEQGQEGIDCLVLKNKEKIYSKLFVDCTGFKSLLLNGYLKEKFNDMSHVLLNNKAWVSPMEFKDKEKEIEPFTTCTALENGWVWNAPLYSRIGTGYVYSNKFISDDQALLEFQNHLKSNKMVIPRAQKDIDNMNFRNINMKIGIHERIFVKNVVAIGLSAGFIEPLESNGLYTVHEFLFQLVDILQRDDISQFDRDMFNVKCINTFNSFLEFVAMHYYLSHRDDSEYWRHIKNTSFLSFPENSIYKINPTRNNGFFDLTNRYMQNWSHPFDNSGIAYIATGMHLNMMNERRFNHMITRESPSSLAEIESVINIWEFKKEQWNRAAQREKSLYEFLKENFYNNID